MLSARSCTARGPGVPSKLCRADPTRSDIARRIANLWPACVRGPPAQPKHSIEPAASGTGGVSTASRPHSAGSAGLMEWLGLRPLAPHASGPRKHRCPAWWHSARAAMQSFEDTRGPRPVVSASPKHRASGRRRATPSSPLWHAREARLLLEAEDGLEARIDGVDFAGRGDGLQQALLRVVVDERRCLALVDL